MKNILKNICFVAIACMTVAIVWLYSNRKRAVEKNAVATENIKAYESLLAGQDGERRVLKLTVKQLEHSRDSVIREMDSVRQAMDIKARELKSLQYLPSVVTRLDTVVFRDTIFREGVISLDTVIGDRWYELRLGLSYPGSIAVSPRFTSRKYIAVRTRKETVNPPKKCWLLRLFQKKHRVAIVEVREENPYITDSVGRYIELAE